MLDLAVAKGVVLLLLLGNIPNAIYAATFTTLYDDLLHDKTLCYLGTLNTTSQDIRVNTIWWPERATKGQDKLSDNIPTINKLRAEVTKLGWNTGGGQSSLRGDLE